MAPAKPPRTADELAAIPANPPLRRRTEPAERTQSAHSSRNWLDHEPSTWPGRTVRHRQTGLVHTIRHVFKNGRVELERNWMTYSSDIHGIRSAFEAAGS